MNNTQLDINALLESIAAEKERSANGKQKILEARLAFGRHASALGAKISSAKLLGQELAKRFPASQHMDPALRSNCRWLAEALEAENHEANDVLEVLRVNSIFEVGSENPTVIRRKYNKAKIAQVS